MGVDSAIRSRARGGRALDTAAYRSSVAEDGRLADEPFTFTTRDDGTVVVHYRAAPVTMLRGRAAERFLTRAAAAGDDPLALQHLMARATGTFRHGNERRR
jgi:hypothetical protein